VGVLRRKNDFGADNADASLLKPHLHEQWRFQFLSHLTDFARLSNRF